MKNIVIRLIVAIIISALFGLMWFLTEGDLSLAKMLAGLMLVCTGGAIVMYSDEDMASSEEEA